MGRLSAIITKADTDQAQAAIEAMAATEAMVAIAAMAAIEAIEAHTKANMVASDHTTTTTVANRLSAIITKVDTDQAQAAIEAMAAIEAITKTNMVASDPITTTTMANRLSDITKAHTDQAQAAIEATTWYPPILYLNDCRTRHTIPTCLTSISSSV